MVYITGDTHADFSRFYKRNFPDQKEMTRSDHVIVCGDFGIWNKTPDDKNRLDALAKRDFTILFCDGNHENFDRLYSDEFPVVDYHGGKAHRIRGNIYHLIRGEVFSLDGKTFWAFGGAQSHDIRDGILDPDDPDFEQKYRICRRSRMMFRVNHKSWWAQEMPSIAEMNHGADTLAAHDWRVDYIITHCCPHHIAALYSGGAYEPDPLTQYFDDVAARTDFDRWFFGHYHKDWWRYGRYEMLYHGIRRIV